MTRPTNCHPERSEGSPEIGTMHTLEILRYAQDDRGTMMTAGPWRWLNMKQNFLSVGWVKTQQKFMSKDNVGS